MSYSIPHKIFRAENCTNKKTLFSLSISLALVEVLAGTKIE
jgi:hypothetical protein